MNRIAHSGIRRGLGILLIVLGVGVGGYAVLVGLMFTGVYLMGYIGTDGREAGRELVFMAGTTVVAAILAFVLVRLGRWLQRSGS